MGNLKKFIKKGIKIIKRKELIPIPRVLHENNLLEGKIALITGGSSGIGYAIANEFVNNGCKIIIAGRDKDKLEKSILNMGDKARTLCMDITDINSIEKKVIQAEKEFEENRIDILVNCAGIISKKGFSDVDEAEYENVMNTNVKGVFFLSRCVGNRMIKKQIKGHILNVSSSSALRPAWTPYQISKWAVRGMTLGLADNYLPYGIIVNAIAPGPCATPMLGKEYGDSLYDEELPFKRFSTPEEIAVLAVYLVSPIGDIVVGDTLYATGGSGILDLSH